MGFNYNSSKSPKYFKNRFAPESATRTPPFICFYCRRELQQGTGRRFKTTLDGPIWEVHHRHRALPSEIPVPDGEE